MTDDLLLLLLRAAMVLLLYLFLFALLRAIGRDLRVSAHSEPAAPPRPVPDRLLVVDPGSSSLRPGVAFELWHGAILGRASEADIRLDDEFVSSRHAAIAPRDGEWWLRDLGSTNGTRLNEELLDGDTPLGHGDVVGIGGVRLKLVRARRAG